MIRHDSCFTIPTCGYVTEERIVTFVYAASDEARNSAVALKEFMESKKT